MRIMTITENILVVVWQIYHSHYMKENAEQYLEKAVRKCTRHRWQTDPGLQMGNYDENWCATENVYSNSHYVCCWPDRTTEDRCWLHRGSLLIAPFMATRYVAVITQRPSVFFHDVRSVPQQVATPNSQETFINSPNGRTKTQANNVRISQNYATLIALSVFVW